MLVVKQLGFQVKNSFLLVSYVIMWFGNDNGMKKHCLYKYKITEIIEWFLVGERIITTNFFIQAKRKSNFDFLSKVIGLH